MVILFIILNSDSDMDFSERLKEQMKRRDIKARDVVENVVVSKGAVSQWVNGIAEPRGRHAERLAEYLGVNLKWLMTGNGPVNTLEGSAREAEYAGDFDTWDNDTPLGEDEVEIPFYKEVELAAGNGMIVQREDIGRKLRFAKSTLRRAGVDPAAAACVTVTGDSMMPVLPDGATVGIDTSNKRIKDGEMYAIDHDGHLRVKVLHRIGGTGIRLRSFNATHYPDEDYKADQAKSIKVIGRVFWYSVLR